MFKKLFRRKPAPSAPDAPQIGDHAAAVESYYDDWTHRYLEDFGDTFQTLRTQDMREMMAWFADFAEIEDGQRLLDAGCGVGGPASAIAALRQVKIDGVTLSAVQVEEGGKLLAERGQSGSISLHKGDFHELEQILPRESYDRVLFMEALVHSASPENALKSAFQMLKPGGKVAIKDMYRHPAQNAKEKALVDRAIRNTNLHFRLFVIPKEDLIRQMENAGFVNIEVEDIPLKEEFDWDTGNNFVQKHGIDVFEGPRYTYLWHAMIKGEKPL